MRKQNHEADIKNHNGTTLDRNNVTYKQAQDNHSNQLNQNNRLYQTVQVKSNDK